MPISISGPHVTWAAETDRLDENGDPVVFRLTWTITDPGGVTRDATVDDALDLRDEFMAQLGEHDQPERNATMLVDPATGKIAG